jgi:hypothetical protein
LTFGLSSAVIGGIVTAGAGIGSALLGGNAAQNAANTQAAASGHAIDVQNQQFQAIQKLLAPYVQAGTGAIGAQQNLLGINGNDAQASAINGIKTSSQFDALNRTGQEAILQNASATGGLRGGNVEAALAQFSPALLNELIQKQFSNLGGLSTVGANAAAGLGTATQANANNVSNLLNNQGTALGNGQLLSAAMYGGIGNALSTGIGTYNANSNGGWKTFTL